MKSVRKVTRIDIHAFSAEHPEWIKKDGAHPNNDGAAAIAQEVYTTLMQMQHSFG